MYIVGIGLFIILFLVQLVYLYKAFKTKDNKYWTRFFSLIAGSALACVIISLYEIISIERTDIEELVMVIMAIIALLCYGGVLILGILLKIYQSWKLKRDGITTKKLDVYTKQVAIGIPLLCGIFISCCFCSVDFAKYETMEYMENKRYEEVKKKKLVEMVNYLNNKYDTDFTVSDNIYYREENYEDDGGWFYSEYYNIPYIGIFDNGEKKITVADRNDVLSDNGQLEEINILIANYYGDITGVKIDFVNIRDHYAVDEDNHIGMTMQYGYNELITEDNIDLFLKELFKGDSVEMIFYVKDGEDREEKLTLLTTRLRFLEQYPIDNIVVYLYDENEKLIIEEKKVDLSGDHKYGFTGENTSDYNDECKFGYYYVPNSHETYGNVERENTFTVIAYSLKRNSYGYKYNNKNTRILNGWIVYEFEKEVS